MYKSTKTCKATNMWRVKKTGKATSTNTGNSSSDKAQQLQAMGITSSQTRQAMRIAQEHHDLPDAAPADKQILAIASYVHQQCEHQMTIASESLTLPSLTIVKQLMELISQQTLLQAVTNDQSSQGLHDLLKDTKKIAAIVKRMVKLHAVILFLESAALLEDLIPAIGDVYLALMQLPNSTVTPSNTNWKHQQSRLEFLVERAKFEKSFLLQETTRLPPSIATYLETKKGAKELLRVLQRHKRKLFQKAVKNDAKHNTTKRDRAKESLEYLNQFLEKLINEPFGGDDGDDDTTLDASSYTAMTLDGDASYATWDNSTLCTLTQSLPSWAICPISKQVMMDPVTVRGDCNHTLSQKVFQEWISVASNKNCPVCGCKLKSLSAKVNTQLKWQIAEKLDDDTRSLNTIGATPTATGMNITTTTNTNDNNNEDTRANNNSPAPPINIVTDRWNVNTTGYVDATPPPPMIRRFSTGDFTKGRALVAADHGTNDNTNTATSPKMTLECEAGVMPPPPTSAFGHKPANGGGLLDDELGPSAHPTNYENMLLFFNNNTNCNDPDMDKSQASVSTLGCGDDHNDTDDDEHVRDHSRRGRSNSFEDDDEDYEVPLKDDDQDLDYEVPLGGESTKKKKTNSMAGISLDQMFNDVLNRQTTTDTQMTEVVDNRAFTSSIGPPTSINTNTTTGMASSSISRNNTLKHLQNSRNANHHNPLLRKKSSGRVERQSLTIPTTIQDDSQSLDESDKSASSNSRSKSSRKQAWKSAAKAKQRETTSDDGMQTSQQQQKEKKKDSERKTRSLSPFRGAKTTANTNNSTPQQKQADYLMVDRAAAPTSPTKGSKNKKNPVKKLFKMLKGNNSKEKEATSPITSSKDKIFRVSANKHDPKNALKLSTLSPPAMTTGKVTVQLMNNASANTALTARDMSGSLNTIDTSRRTMEQEDRYNQQLHNQCVSNCATLGNDSGHSLTITGRSPTATALRSSGGSRNNTEEPPPLVPMTRQRRI